MSSAVHASGLVLGSERHRELVFITSSIVSESIDLNYNSDIESYFLSFVRGR